MDCFTCDGWDPPKAWKEAYFHDERQDVSSEAWRKLEAIIEQASSERWRVFRPREHLGRDLMAQIVELPDSIASLKRITKLDLYGSNLVRLPAAIGEMTALEEFTPYTSQRLH